MIKVYLACPYSHADKSVREHRVEQVNKKAAELMMSGYLVFSPLSHSHPISKHCDVDPCDNGFWLRQDLWILKFCDELHILCIDGWKQSVGIKIEIKEAKNIGMEVVYHGDS